MPTKYESLKHRTEQVVCNTYGRYPLAIAKAQGARLWDLDGNEYTDLLAGIAVANVGHSHPEVVAAACKAMEKLIHVSNVFYQEEQTLLAEKLVAGCGADKVFFCNSGAEANEAAIKLARRYMQKVKGTGAYEVVTLEGSFHGRTLATVAATGQEFFKDGFAPMPEGFRYVPFGDPAALEAAISDKTAAVLVEIVQGEGGVKPMGEEYARAVQDICKRKGVLFMVDEIQTGMGRTGKLWAHQHYGLTPDVFTTAKGLANGLPMGALLATDEAAQGFAPGSHATTFGGGGALSAAALAVLEVMERDDLPGRAATLGAAAVERFRELQAKHPDKISEVRGLGLMLGVELSFPGQDVWNALLDKGFVCNLAKERILRLLPPLVIEEADLERFAAALDEVLQKS